MSETPAPYGNNTETDSRQRREREALARRLVALKAESMATAKKENRLREEYRETERELLSKMESSGTRIVVVGNTAVIGQIDDDERKIRIMDDAEVYTA